MKNGQESYKQYYLPTAEIKDYNVMIGGRNFFNQTIKNDFTTYDIIQKIATGQGDDYTNPYFKEYYKLIGIDLSKSQKLDADPKTMQKINFAGYLKKAEGAIIFLIIDKAKETVLDLSKEAVKLLWFYFVLM